MTARRVIVNVLKINEIIVDTNSTLDNLFSVILVLFPRLKEIVPLLHHSEKKHTGYNIPILVTVATLFF